MNARDKLFDTVAHSMATSEEFPEQEARRLIDAVVAEVRAEAADFLSEIGTPITGERTEHERGVMYASERLRAMVAPTPAPVESAGDETGEAKRLRAELERVRGERDRYRNAWQNARTRAADGWADAAKAEAELVPLCELERRVTEQLEDFEEGLEEDPGAPAIARNMTALLARAVRGDR